VREENEINRVRTKKKRMLFFDCLAFSSPKKTTQLTALHQKKVLESVRFLLNAETRRPCAGALRASAERASAQGDASKRASSAIRWARCFVVLENGACSATELAEDVEKLWNILSCQRGAAI